MKQPTATGCGFRIGPILIALALILAPSIVRAQGRPVPQDPSANPAAPQGPSAASQQPPADPSAQQPSPGNARARDASANPVAVSEGPANAATPQAVATPGAEAQPPPARAEHLHESDIPALPGMRIEAANPVETPERAEVAEPPPSHVHAATPKATAASVASPKKSGSTVKDGLTTGVKGGVGYAVRGGDTLGTIAHLFNLDAADLARANHIAEDSVLHSGQTLKIPNPFSSQVRRLEATVEQLGSDARAAHQKERIDGAKIQSLNEQLDQVRASNQDLQHGVKVLPWWRGLALTTGAAALLMLGIAVLTVLEWLVLRRRFRALAEANEAIRRLDQKYKVALAKAELRLQQLYGRRRSLEEDAETNQSAEEIEIERLNQQLKQLLEEHLEKLGLGRERTGRRNRLRDLLTGVEEEPPVEARAGRR